MSPEFQQTVVVTAAAALAVIWIALRVRRFIRRRRPPRIHPKLARYQYGEGVSKLRSEEAQKIIATSSTNQIAGYQVVRQIEAVFVDGFRRPEEAIEGLKAASAMKGANAVLNVRHNPSSMGRYSAAGDAVVVESPKSSGSSATDGVRRPSDNPGGVDESGAR